MRSTKICNKDFAKKMSVIPKGMIKPPYYRRVPNVRKIPARHWLYQRYTAHTDDGARLFDYYKMADLVRSLPTVSEKIDFVSPYERAWSRFEKVWHRPFHTPLVVPRRAWCLPEVPHYFDSLNFYKYLTKSRLLMNEEATTVLDAYYAFNGDAENYPVEVFQDKLVETLISFLNGQESPTDSSSISLLLRTLFEDAYTALAAVSQSKHDLLRFSHSSRCESFWIRSGFKKLYKRHNVYCDETYDTFLRFTADDRRRLGELAFTMRDNLCAQTRSVVPIRNIFDWEDKEELESPIFSEHIDLDDVIFNPLVYNLSVDDKILFQCPGFDSDVGETHKYGCVAIKNSSEINKFMEHWKPSLVDEAVEMRKESHAATVLSSLFNWLNGQAHCQGYTQYTDIESPLTSQLILSDGKEFSFGVAQLNTIAINIDVEGFVNNRTNLCCMEGPFNLYDEFDNSTKTFKYRTEMSDGKIALVDGLNPHVIRRILQMYSTV